MGNEFHLLVDDRREMEVDHIARTAQDGRRAILAFPVTDLYMDYDLGMLSDTDGCQFLSWALERGIHPRRVHLVSAHATGLQNMTRVLESFGYTMRLHVTGHVMIRYTYDLTNRMKG